MSTDSWPRALVLVSIFSCALVGGYCTMVAGSQDGLFDALASCIQLAEVPHIPGGPSPLKTRYTGIAAIDDQLLVLVAFFAVLIDGDKSWAIRVSSRYLMAQFCAAWMLLVLEGHRRGNRGKAVSWTGTMGIIFQNITYTITVPIYLLIHLFTSPTAKSSPAPSPDTFAVDELDISLIPLCTLLGMVVPTIAMCLPSPSYLSPTAHYNFLAIWQAFPMWQTLLHTLLGSFLSRRRRRSTPPPPARVPTEIYSLVFCVTAASHAALVAACLAQASWIPAPALVNVYRTLVPYPPWSPPTVPLVAGSGRLAAGPVFPADALSPPTHFFLQWDLYCGSAALLLWAAYLRQRGKRTRAAGTRVWVWAVVAGPVGGAAMLLWERDEAAVRGEEKKRR